MGLPLAPIHCPLVVVRMPLEGPSPIGFGEGGGWSKQHTVPKHATSHRPPPPHYGPIVHGTTPIHQLPQMGIPCIPLPTALPPDTVLLLGSLRCLRRGARLGRGPRLALHLDLASLRAHADVQLSSAFERSICYVETYQESRAASRQHSHGPVTDEGPVELLQVEAEADGVPDPHAAHGEGEDLLHGDGEGDDDGCDVHGLGVDVRDDVEGADVSLSTSAEMQRSGSGHANGPPWV